MAVNKSNWSQLFLSCPRRKSLRADFLSPNDDDDDNDDETDDRHTSLRLAKDK